MFKSLTSFLWCVILGIFATVSFAALQPFRTVAQPEHSTIVKILPNPVGRTTQYIGAVEGNVNFDPDDLTDLGINTYRIYGGMSRWEAEDDDSIYGYPTIAQIKANPNVVNWAWWDKAMTTPPQGSDYWWSGRSGEIWQGNARTLFSQLQQANIRPVLTIRNVDGDWNPSWALQLNPPRTAEDWNEWWEHVFATVYWLNVRNDYQVNEFEIHNEPDVRIHGWGGTFADYAELVRVAKDAIDHVYRTYLPNRVYHIHAPIAAYQHWVYGAMSQMPKDFDSMNFHIYSPDVSGYIATMRRAMNQAGLERFPIWVGEWGTYQESYNDWSIALTVLKNLMRMAQPGDTYVYGNHLFSLYSWGGERGFAGLINRRGNRQLSYYAMRMGIRALQGGKDVLPVVPTPEEIMVMATRDDRNLNVLLVNDQDDRYEIAIDLSALQLSEAARLWQLSANMLDQPLSAQALDQGRLQVQLAAHSAIMAQASLEILD
ncbi:MAG: hypothetical protein NZ772_08125 [Cyanobacteria bacterium]|nr:hypothetical protein [Cyanobacteriota bacterium]MDW8200174.1 hypothetical protein [Cyanobacteriota bacterium SKYGB_h_bin112]